MELGRDFATNGDVTTLTGCGLFTASNIEDMIGYGAGRLDKGYYVLLLKQGLTGDDFTFAGTTLRSGGRLGLPAATKSADDARIRVHDRILREHGSEGYRVLQKGALTTVANTGGTRIAKVLPVIRHAEGLPPNVQYPMGGGGLQWTLTKERKFFVAALVDEHGMGFWAGESAMIGLRSPNAAMVEARTKLRRYLETIEFGDG